MEQYFSSVSGSPVFQTSIQHCRILVTLNRRDTVCHIAVLNCVLCKVIIQFLIMRVPQSESTKRLCVLVTRSFLFDCSRFDGAFVIDKI